MLVLATVVVCLAVACVVYGWFEAGWLRTRVLDVEIEGLAVGLDGLRIAHLSDFHLGARLSRGNRASVKAAAWVVERCPDVVCITGDLVSHPRGESRLQGMVRTLDRPFVVLGNHDVAVTRDPFSRAAELHDLEHARLLTDEYVTLERDGERLLVAGVDPVSYRAGRARPAGPCRRGRGHPQSRRRMPRARVRARWAGRQRRRARTGACRGRRAPA